MEHRPPDLPNAVAIDCEMVQTELCNSALARVCAVSWDEQCILDTYVDPGAPVTDYLTRYSGIRARDLEGAPPFGEVRSKVAKLLEGRIVIGHGVHNDLKALQLAHPSSLTIDTAELDWPQRKLGLKALTFEVLGISIQRGGHSPHEDALASLRLLKAHRGAIESPARHHFVCFVHSHDQPEPPFECTSEAVETLANVLQRSNDESREWALRVPWSTPIVRELLAWYATSAVGKLGSVSGEMRFAPSLSKEHREVIHAEAKTVGLSTRSAGIGVERAIHVLPPGIEPNQPDASTQQRARLVYKWAREDAEQAPEGAAPVPYSLGEITEMLAPHFSLPWPQLITQHVARACAIELTTPTKREGEAAAGLMRLAYERCLLIHRRIDVETIRRLPMQKDSRPHKSGWRKRR